VVPAAGVVGEAMLAIVLAGAYRDKFGGDHIDDVLGAVDAYEKRIGWTRRTA
jgi:chorismate synthase